MKKLSYVLILLISVWLGGCDDSSDALPYGYIGTTQEGSSTMVLKGYENYSDGFNVFEAEGFDAPFYIQEKKFVGKAYRFAAGNDGKLTDMTEVPTDEAWQESIEIVEGKNYWMRYKTFVKYVFLKVRVAYINGNNVGIEYVIGGTKDRDLTENLNANIVSGDNVSVTSYEIPYLNSANLYVDHYVEMEDKQVLNYALEWNAEKKHAAWVAFSFDEVTSKDVVSRTDAWDVDPGLPADMQTTEAQHKSDGYDKGHICASEDRVYSKEANEQTFYYSNMSPQISSFNQGFWQKLEARVQKWGRSTPTTYDKVYVTKGGTINQLLISFTGLVKAGDSLYPTTNENGFTIHGLACPKYYYMAILSEKGDAYHAIGFWIAHREDLPKQPTVDELKKYAVSIDELEEYTGLDFFCNLPDVIEDEVESSFNTSDWAW